VPGKVAHEIQNLLPKKGKRGTGRTMSSDFSIPAKRPESGHPGGGQLTAPWDLPSAKREGDMTRAGGVQGRKERARSIKGKTLRAT